MNSTLLRRAPVAFAALILAAPALASEAAPTALKASLPAGTAGPYVLGAPPAWAVMMLGLAIVSVTVLRRARKGG